MSLWTSPCVRGHSDAGTGKQLTQIVTTKLEGYGCVKFVALTFSLAGNKGLSPNLEKQPYTNIPPPPSFTVGTMHR